MEKLKLNADRIAFLKEIKEILDKRSDELFAETAFSSETMFYNDGKQAMLDGLIAEIEEIVKEGERNE